MDVRQLLIPVGLLVQRLLDQFPREALGSVLVVPAVDLIDPLLSITPHHKPLPDVAGRAAEGVRNGDPPAAGVGESQVLAEFTELCLFHQDICQGEVEEFPQHILFLTCVGADDVLKLFIVFHNVSFLQRIAARLRR